MNDLHNNIELRRGISPEAGRGNDRIKTEWVDRAGFGSVTYIVVNGEFTDPLTQTQISGEHADESDYSDSLPLDSELLSDAGEFPAGSIASNLAFKLRYTGSRRFIRLHFKPQIFVLGNFYTSGFWLLGQPRL